MSRIKVRKATDEDGDWIDWLIREQWGSDFVASRGKRHVPCRLPALLALIDGKRGGLLTFRIADQECEIVTLNSLQERQGIGNALVSKMIEMAKIAHCTRIWLVTTNDNTDAMRFYQKMGFRFSAIHRNAVDEARKLKPSIPEYSNSGIRITDEVEMEYQM
ncbi:GNAT family N-acetyltransferase [Candidatus Thorarchaeota archaeon]|nr:MAG: GNAT family N-acetyltransferase [Candidatus Thorarchaeota archaeon]